MLIHIKIQIMQKSYICWNNSSTNIWTVMIGLIIHQLCASSSFFAMMMILLSWWWSWRENQVSTWPGKWSLCCSDIVGVLGRYRLIRYGNQVKVKAPKMASLTFTLSPQCMEGWKMNLPSSPWRGAAASRKTSPRLTCFVRNLTSFA